MQTIQFPYTDNFWEKAIQWANNAPIVVFTCNSTTQHQGFDNYLAIGNIENKITIITPSYRIDNLLKLEKSINFDYVNEWIIVYDQSKMLENPNIFKNNKWVCPKSIIRRNYFFKIFILF